MVPGFIAAAMLAQSTAAPAPADAAQLERIRKGLAEPPPMALAAPAPREGYVFRVTVDALVPNKPVWDNWANVPSYIRPSMPIYHYEFLQQVTPEDFRASTLYPGMIGVPVIPLLAPLTRWIQIAGRHAQERAARKEVQEALQELSACRTAPSKPGC